MNADSTKATVTGAVATGLPGSDLRRCPRCEERLPLSQFGVCRARMDGINLYCLVCTRKKVNASRQRRRAWLEVKKKRQKAAEKVRAARVSAGSFVEPATRDEKDLMRMVRRLPIEDRIEKVLALSDEPLTQAELRHICRLDWDVLGDQLSRILGRTVGSRNGSGPRIYYLLSKAPDLPEQSFARDTDAPPSFGVSTIYQQGEGMAD